MFLILVRRPVSFRQMGLVENHDTVGPVLLGHAGEIDAIHHQRDVARRITLGQGDDIGPDAGAGSMVCWDQSS